jgi:chromosome segregation protein
VRLLRMEVRGFRAFARPVEFKFGGTNIFGGPNGTGKTSVFDAIEWCLFGSIPRLSGTRDFVRAGNVYQNLFEGTTSLVAIELVSDSGKRLNRVRTAAACHSSLQGKEVDEKTFASLLGMAEMPTPATFLRNNLLQQETVNEFVRDLNPRGRYDAMLSLVRDESSQVLLERIESAVASIDGLVARSTSEREGSNRRILDLESDLAALRQAGGNISFESLVQRYQETLTDAHRFLEIVPPGEHTPKEASALAKSATALSEKLRKAVDELRDAVSQLNKITPLVKEGVLQLQESTIREQIEKMRTAIKDTQQSFDTNRKEESQKTGELDAVKGELQREERNSESLRTVLARIKGVVVSDACPVCLRPIGKKELLEIIDRQIGDVGRQLADMFQKREGIQTALNNIKAQKEVLQSALQSQNADLAKRQDALNRRAYTESTLERVRSLEIIRRSRLATDDVLTLSDGIQRTVENLDRLSRKAAQLVSDIELLSSQSLIPKKEEQLQQVRSVSTRLGADLERSSRASSLLMRVRSAVLEARAKTVTEVLESYKPLIRDLYYRFEPHPVFSEIDFEVTKAFKDTELYFVVAPRRQGPKAYPSTVFSTSQLNALAVCVFLALNLKSAKSIPWLMLDDPIQAMDDLNILGFCEVLRQVRGERQVFISSHNQQLFELLLNKLRPMSQTDEVKGFWFESWAESGPNFVEKVVEYRPASYDMRLIRQVVGKRKQAS